MKTILKFTIILVLSTFVLKAQRDVVPTNKTDYLTDNQVKNFIKAYNDILKLSPEEREFIKTHSYEKDKNAPVYDKLKKIISDAGFSDYPDFRRVSDKVTRAWRISKNPQNTPQKEEAIKKLDEKLNDPNLTDEAKARIRMQKDRLQNGKGNEKDIATIAPYQKELDYIFTELKK